MDQGWFLRRFPSRNGTSTCCLYLGFEPRLWKKCVLILSQAWWMKWNGKFLFILITLDKPPIIHLFPLGYFPHISVTVKSMFSHRPTTLKPHDGRLIELLFKRFNLAISADTSQNSEGAIYISQHFSAPTWRLYCFGCFSSEARKCLAHQHQVHVAGYFAAVTSGLGFIFSDIQNLVNMFSQPMEQSMCS